HLLQTRAAAGSLAPVLKDWPCQFADPAVPRGRTVSSSGCEAASDLARPAAVGADLVPVRVDRKIGRHLLCRKNRGLVVLTTKGAPRIVALGQAARGRVRRFRSPAESRLLSALRPGLADLVARGSWMGLLPPLRSGHVRIGSTDQPTDHRTASSSAAGHARDI